MRSLLVFYLWALPLSLCAQSAQLIPVVENAWLSLTPLERQALSERFLVNIIPSDTAGVIIDAQTLNESTPGTTAGSQLGAAYGSAIYVDRVFRGPNYNYSATQNVSAALLGAMIGGMVDQRPTTQFHTRYTVRTLDNQIRYHDEVKGSAFRHSVGICVTLAGLQPIRQDVCAQTADQLRKQYLVAASTPAAVAPPPPERPEQDMSTVVRCKFGGSAPILIERALCEIARGEVYE